MLSSTGRSLADLGRLVGACPVRQLCVGMLVVTLQVALPVPRAPVALRMF